MQESNVFPSRKAFLVIDLQNDFCEGGALEVPHSSEIIEPINRLALQFSQAGSMLIATRDNHPAGHESFASQHEGKEAMDVIDLHGVAQILWPDHCVQGTYGAEFHSGFSTAAYHAIIGKGMRKNCDSYSAFIENDKRSQTGLAGLLREMGISQVYMCGLATNFCVLYSALDAVELGFKPIVLWDLCRGIFPEASSEAQTKQQMLDAGVEVMLSSELGL